MNKLTPYEESLSRDLGQLPVPSADKGWQEMQRLLDKDDNNRRIVPPPQLRGCLIPGLLLGLILVGAVYFLYPENWFKSNKNKPVDSTVNALKNVDRVNENVSGTSTGTTLPDTHPVSGNDKEEINAVVADPPKGITKSSTGTITAIDKRNEAGIQTPPSAGGIERGNFDKATTKGKRSLTKKVENSFKNNSSIAGNHSAANADAGSKAAKRRRSRSTEKSSRVTISAPPTEDTDNMLTKGNEKASDLTRAESNKNPDQPDKQDPIIKKEDSTGIIVNTNTPGDSVSNKKPKGTKKKKYYLGAGITVYKGLPLNGDIDAAVNNSGRKNALSDYIPSVYARFYKDKKWFLQGEFRYGVPQYTRAFVYKQNLKVDAQQNTTTSSYKLRKTYYHQIPVSFNHFILPGWSVGTGIIYNRFSGALSSESVISANTRMVNDSVVSFHVINDKNDSSFARNTFQWLIETQYQWKRFSFGARYARGLQPYIRYTDPETNMQVSKKSNSLYLFLRYELWNSKRK